MELTINQERKMIFVWSHRARKNAIWIKVFKGQEKQTVLLKEPIAENGLPQIFAQTDDEIKAYVDSLEFGRPLTSIELENNKIIVWFIEKIFAPIISIHLLECD